MTKTKILFLFLFSMLLSSGTVEKDFTSGVLGCTETEESLYGHAKTTRALRTFSQTKHLKVLFHSRSISEFKIMQLEKSDPVIVSIVQLHPSSFRQLPLLV
ncbi:MAG: hypothetical protein JNL74_10305 [Fibrobacteres bacterium]|nr:hypothetical protein [Fibrobacterota bacterium]